jgi:hypothetical protein
LSLRRRLDEAVADDEASLASNERRVCYNSRRAVAGGSMGGIVDLEAREAGGRFPSRRAGFRRLLSRFLASTSAASLKRLSRSSALLASLAQLRYQATRALRSSISRTGSSVPMQDYDGRRLALDQWNREAQFKLTARAGFKLTHVNAAARRQAQPCRMPGNIHEIGGGGEGSRALLRRSIGRPPSGPAPLALRRYERSSRSRAPSPVADALSSS